MKDAGFSLNAESVFGPAKNGAIVSSGVQTVDQLQRGHKIVKGQLISKGPFGVIVWTKIPTKFFPRFLP